MYIKVTGTGSTAQRRGWFVFHFIDENNSVIPITLTDVVAHNFTENITASHFSTLFQQALTGVAITPSRITTTEVSSETYFIVKIPSAYKVSKIKFKTWSTDGSYFTNTKVSFSKNNEENSYKDIDNITASARNTIYESISLFKILNPTNKTLILHNGEYKKFIKRELGKEEGNAVPPMSSHTDGYFTVSSSSEQSTFPSWLVFDRVKDSSKVWLTASGVNTNQYLKVKLDRKRKVYLYRVTNRGGAGAGYKTHAPKDFELQGSDDDNIWNTISSVSNQTDWGNGETREFNIENPSDFLYYRLFVINNNGGTVIAVGELELIAEKIDSIYYNWSTVSQTTPTQEQFLSDGMDSLTPLLDRRVETLDPLPMTDKSNILLAEGEGKIFSKTINSKKYLDIRSIEVEVE